MVLRISGIGPFQTPKLLGYISGRLTGGRRSHHNSSQTVLKGYAKPTESSVIHLRKLGLSNVTKVNDADVALFFVCERYLVFAYPGFPIEALDLQTGLRSTSDYLIRNDLARTALSSKFTLESTDIFFAEYQSHTERSR